MKFQVFLQFAPGKGSMKASVSISVRTLRTENDKRNPVNEGYKGLKSSAGGSLRSKKRIDQEQPPKNKNKPRRTIQHVRTINSLNIYKIYTFLNDLDELNQNT